MAKRHYSDAQKAEALAVLDANEGNLARTARELSIPINTLRRWKSGEGIAGVTPDMRHEKKAQLAALLETELHAILQTMPAKRGDASYRDLATGLGILFDKLRLVQGLPTVIVEVLPDILAQLAALDIDPAVYFTALKEELQNARRADAD